MTATAQASYEDLQRRIHELEQEVTYCRQLQKAALIERRNWLGLLDGLPAYAFLEGSDHAILYGNDFFRERFGNPEGRSCHEILPQNRKEGGCPASESLAAMTARTWEWSHAEEGRSYQVYDYPFCGNSQTTPLVLEIGIDVTVQQLADQDRELFTAELKAAIAEIRLLRSILPVCSRCGRPREGSGLLPEGLPRAEEDLCPECRSRLESRP